MRPAPLRSAMTIYDPVSAANLTVYLVQLPCARTAPRKQPTAAPLVDFITLEHARAAGEVVISETGTTERVRLENHSRRDLFLQAGEVLRGGDQDRAVAGDLIIPALGRELESHWIPTFCAEPERSTPMRNGTPDLFTQFDQFCPGVWSRMRWCGLIVNMDGSFVHAAQIVWKGVFQRSVLRCLAKLYATTKV